MTKVHISLGDRIPKMAERLNRGDCLGVIVRERELTSSMGTYQLKTFDNAGDAYLCIMLENPAAALIGKDISGNTYTTYLLRHFGARR